MEQANAKQMSSSVDTNKRVWNPQRLNVGVLKKQRFYAYYK